MRKMRRRDGGRSVESEEEGMEEELKMRRRISG